jgi:hypothetical protein
VRSFACCLFAVAAAAALAGACSSDDDGHLVTALADGLSETAEANGQPLDIERTTCMAEAFVDVLGADALEQSGVTTASLESGEFHGRHLWEIHEVGERQSARMARQIFECLDATEMLADELEHSGLPRAIGMCVAREVLQGDEYRLHYAATLRGESVTEFELPGDLQPTMSRCAAAGD